MQGTMRQLSFLVPAVCALVLLPAGTNFATGIAPPQWLLSHRWLSWLGVGVFGAVAVVMAVREQRERRAERDGWERRARARTTGDSGTPDPPSWGDLGDAVTVRLAALPEKVRGRDPRPTELTEERRRGGLVILVGAGGTGKSTLARELVRRDGLADRPDRVWEVSAATPASLTPIAQCPRSDDDHSGGGNSRRLLAWPLWLRSMTA